MQLKFTAAGKILFDSNPSAFTVTRLVLTNASGYALGSPPAALQGTIVFDRTENLPAGVMNTNTLRFIAFLDDSIGPFSFGEAGLYSGATLVAVGVNPTLISKYAASGADNGNNLTLNFFLSYANSDSYGFVKLGNSDSRYQLGQIQNVDYLDPPYEGDPNTYIVNGLTPSDMPCIAFSDIYGRWAFTNRSLVYYTGVVSNATPIAVDIATPHGVAFDLPTDYVLQFVSGRLRGYCRQLTNVGAQFFQWNTPALHTPEVGDQFIIAGPGVGEGAFNALEARVTTLEDQMEFVLANLGSGGGAVPPTYVPGVATLGSTPAAGTFEIGTIINPQFTNTFTQNNAGAFVAGRLRRNSTVISSSFPYTDSNVALTTAPVVYDSQVDHAEGPVLNDSLGNPYPSGHILAGTVISASRTFTPSRKTFYGTPVATPTNSAGIRGLSSNFIVSENAQVDANGGDLVGAPVQSFTIFIPAGATRVVFAYPATLRDVASVRYQELSNVEVKSNFNITVVAVEGANAYAPVNYKVWTYVPVEPFPANANYKVFI